MPHCARTTCSTATSTTLAKREIIIVDEFTGRLTGRRWVTASRTVEAKERRDPEREPDAGLDHLPELFRMYGAGRYDRHRRHRGLRVPGDLRSGSKVIPPNKPTVRKDELDLIYGPARSTTRCRRHPRLPLRGQPTLVGTTSIEIELIADLLNKARLPHRARRQAARQGSRDHVRRRADPASYHRHQHGCRGTDIVLGGSVENQTKFLLADERWRQRNRGAAPASSSRSGGYEKVKAEGGRIALPSAMRAGIDTSRAARAPRDRAVALPSLKIRRCASAGDRVKAIMEAEDAGGRPSRPASSTARSSTQRKVEARSFDIRSAPGVRRRRQHDQRKVIYQRRNEILESSSVARGSQSAQERDDRCRTYVPASVEESGRRACSPAARRMAISQSRPAGRSRKEQTITDDDIVERVMLPPVRCLQARCRRWAGPVQPFMRMVLLRSIDSHWREHLAALDYAPGRSSQATRRAKQNTEKALSCCAVADLVKLEVTRLLMTVRIQSQEQVSEAAQAIEERASQVSNVTYTHPNEDGSVSEEADRDTQVLSVPKVGRNEPCPCGSGKKYKHCHGKLA